MNILIVGLGLMGGSLAKALSARTEHRVYGADRSGAACRLALDTGAVQGIRTLEAAQLQDIDLAMVALYPEACIETLNLLAESLPEGAILSDLCGIKRHVMEHVDPRGRVHYVSTHPMAGREVSGGEHAMENLYERASLLICPAENCPEEAVETLKAVMAPCGFSRMIVTTPENHDRMIAYTSQLAHVVSAAYVRSPAALLHIGYSAGSFRDMTRVARLNPDMWTDLFLHNADYLTEEIDTVLSSLSELRQAIADRDEEKLHSLLAESTARKEYLNDRDGGDVKA